MKRMVDNAERLEKMAEKVIYEPETNSIDIDGNLKVNGIFKDIKNIVDSAERRRFFDMPLTLSNDLKNLGLRMTYGKVGLSGNHLSIVAIIVNKSDNLITIPKNSEYASVDFGQGENSWIMDKIYPLDTLESPRGNYVAKANVAKILTGWDLPISNVDNIALERTGVGTGRNILFISSTNLDQSAVELPNKSSLRITVDLLIDLE